MTKTNETDAMESVPTTPLDNSCFKVPAIPAKRRKLIKQQKPKILSEDKYIEEMAKIIQRDFFPDLEKLKAQNAYLDAQERKDYAEMEAIRLKYRCRTSTSPANLQRLGGAQGIVSSTSSTSAYMSPTTFETPSSSLSRGSTPLIGGSSTMGGNGPTTTTERKSQCTDDERDEDDLVEGKGRTTTTTEQHHGSQSSTGSSSSNTMDQDNGISSNSSSRSTIISTRRHSLDSFLQTHTSEDNQSFQEIIDNAAKKLKQKFAVLYKEEERSKERLARILQLPTIEQQLMITNSEEEKMRLRPIETWTYENKNSVMYIPDGVELSIEEQRQMSQRKQSIQHHATRLTMNPFNSAGEMNAKQQLDKMEEEGVSAAINEMAVGGGVATGVVGGFRLLNTPSPCPGEAFSPLMTWGEIEGTPFRLDGLDTPLGGGSGTIGSGAGGNFNRSSSSAASTTPAFRINATPRREVIAHELAERIGEKMRAQKQKAMDVARRNIGAADSIYSPLNQVSRRERLASMSPAAQRLASSRLGLRLTPIERRRSLSSLATPPKGTRTTTIRSLITSHVAERITPKLDAGQSVGSPSPMKEKNESGVSSTSSSNLTDDLLKIPSTTIHRTKAADFF